MKKISYISISVFQIFLAIGAYLVQDFSVKRMGMMRHVIFTNQQWEAKFPVEAIKYVYVILTIILTVYMLYLEFKNGKLKEGRLFCILETTMISIIAISLVMMYSTESLIAYYFICLLFALILTIQYIKHLVNLRYANRAGN